MRLSRKVKSTASIAFTVMHQQTSGCVLSSQTVSGTSTQCALSAGRFTTTLPKSALVAIETLANVRPTIVTVTPINNREAMKRKSVDKIARAISALRNNADRVHLAKQIGKVLAKRWSEIFPFDQAAFATQCHAQGGVEPERVYGEVGCFISDPPKGGVDRELPEPTKPEPIDRPVTFDVRSGKGEQLDDGTFTDTLWAVTRTPRQMVGWQSVPYFGEEYVLRGGVHGNVFICLNQPNNERDIHHKA